MVRVVESGYRKLWYKLRAEKERSNSETITVHINKFGEREVIKSLKVLRLHKAVNGNYQVVNHGFSVEREFQRYLKELN